MKTPESMLRDAAPTDGIDAVLAAFRYPSHRSANRWTAAAGLATAVALGAVAFRLSATSAQASPLTSVVQAFEAAPCAVRRSQIDDRGTWKEVDSIFWQEGTRRKYRMRSQGAEIERAFDGRRVWYVQHQAGYALVATDPKPKGFGGDRYDDVRSMLQRYEGRGWSRRRTELSGERVLWRFERDRTARASLWVDRATSRPLALTRERATSAGWQADFRFAWSYPAHLPPETFAFRPPHGFEVYDVDVNLSRLREGLKNGPVQTVGGIDVRLVGALQERSGEVTAIYTGGATPMPDAPASAFRDGETYGGTIRTGVAPEPGKMRAATTSVAAPPSPSLPMTIEATSRPDAFLDGKPLRFVRFRLPKLAGNSARPLRIVLPTVASGTLRTVRQGEWLVRGTGAAKGTVVFDDVKPIRSNMAEELERLSGISRISYEIRLRKASR